MVTTRRQSGKLPPPLIPEPLEDSSDEESDYSTSDSESSNELERRPLKRKKASTENRNGSKATNCRGRISRLSVLTTMPLDILYEVFGHLHPLDLLHLSRLNKGLRRILMSRQSTSVWKTARQRIKGFPPCPDDLSEPQYSRLAFETSCYGCGKSRTLKIDWDIRIRGCQSCLKKLLVWSVKFEKRYPSFPLEIMDLLPYTRRGPHSAGHRTTSRFFWEPAILSIAEKLGKLEDNVTLKKVDAMEALRDFKARKKVEISKIYSHARLCETWKSLAAMEQSDESAAALSRRCDAIHAKLREFNWTPQEISAVSGHAAFGPAHDLTDRIWTRIKPQLELERDAYYERRKQQILDERRSIVSTLYRSYIASATIPHRALPPHREIFEFEGVAEVIGAPLGVQILESDFIDVITKLPILITKWEAVQVQRLLKIFPPRPSDWQYTVSPLKLAINVLKCGFCSTFLLCSDALAHVCDPAFSQKDLTFWETISDIIRDIILALGLDPHTTTDDDLDNLDPRALCLKCAPTPSSNGKACRLARSWRCCVNHFRLDHPDIAESQWQVLDQVQTKQIKVAEGTHSDHLACVWYCKICVNLTSKDLCTYSATVNHIRLAHQKEQPVLGVDIARNPGSSSRRSHPPKLFGDPDLYIKKQAEKKPTQKPRAFKCMHCSRLFVEAGVYQHLRDKHKIANPQVGMDLTRITAVST